ncbi:uncharacterized protein [Halyomorpha halys]|uniref:uncharacterized protein n=1 Tax=Halyomorpha halys TaxID=286706 RepID=UPI0006D5110B
MVAWILRFIRNSRTQKDLRFKSELTVLEIDTDEKILVKIVQSESFQDERKSQLKSLCVFEDETGIFRVKTKITLGEDREDFKTPIVLSGSHELVRRLLYEEHTKMGHVGVQILLCKLRERFWILKGRRTVKTVIATCIRCKRFQGSAIKTKPAILPEERVREALVFEVVGVYLAGPLILRDGEKSWIVLYTCAVYRAVHMELVTSLSTNEFLRSLRRFIAQRGRPKTIFSDNGTNFVGAENLFRNID